MSRLHRGRHEADDAVRVRVFINHLEFSRAWQLAHAKITRRTLEPQDRKNAQNESSQIRWEDLPEIIIEHLNEMPYIGQAAKEMRAIDVYAPISRNNDGSKKELEVWLDKKLDPLPGFQVHNFYIKPDRNKHQCGRCGSNLEKSELIKGLNTKVACDLLSHAVNDSYDIGVLIMNDAELAPSILCVQEIFDKQIIQIGPKGEGDILRSSAWGNLLLDDLIPDLITAEDFKKQYRPRRNTSSVISQS
ncbi:MAG TPA: hypothetical protein VEZ20_00160 [Allosphingosinicella sp.]|jgi:hypothetical protein|nr:hypothetical protein [Allosphingosinicella sp.]